MRRALVFVGLCLVIVGCGAGTPPAVDPVAIPAAELPAIKSGDKRMLVFEDENGADMVWVGEIDEALIRERTGEIYEQLRARKNAELATLPASATRKLYVGVWLSQRARKLEVSYLDANSVELSHVIRPWSEAEVNVRPRRQGSRLESHEEFWVYELLERIQNATSGSTQLPNETTLQLVNREKQMKDDIRDQVAKEMEITTAELRRIEAQYHLWLNGLEATPDNIKEWME